ncbi:hypothetical protein QTP70_021613 [Hemibagrus guttatus]|uniref:Uncharacterized protein n=1 Tax=Hemibagrus guttatus TaxID=175788 RepID=A0AAE0UQ47_9TELE|nr:hypothetical protein QTP70_021613 [Hemibagrus guttatus]
MPFRIIEPPYLTYPYRGMVAWWLGGWHVCLTPPGLGVRFPPPPCVWSLHVLPVPRGFPLGTLVSSPSPKTCIVG